MSNKLFSKEEELELRSSPYVKKVSARSVTFTSEFKKIAYNKLIDGMNMREIFEEHGINTGAMGKSRIAGAYEKIMAKSKIEGGFEECNNRKHKKQEEPDDVKLGRQVRRLEHDLAYAKQEIEFLKKNLQADMEARKQWELKHRQQ